MLYLTSMIFLDSRDFDSLDFQQCGVAQETTNLMIWKSIGFPKLAAPLLIVDLAGVPADVIEILTKGGDAKD